LLFLVLQRGRAVQRGLARLGRCDGLTQGSRGGELGAAARLVDQGQVQAVARLGLRERLARLFHRDALDRHDERDRLLGAALLLLLPALLAARLLHRVTHLRLLVLDLRRAGVQFGLGQQRRQAAGIARARCRQAHGKAAGHLCGHHGVGDREVSVHAACPIASLMAPSIALFWSLAASMVPAFCRCAAAASASGLPMALLR
jgi:hypothetical protein